MLKQLKEKPIILWSLSLALFLMFLDLFFLKNSGDLFFLILTSFWYWANKSGKIDGRFSIACGLFFLSLCPLLMFFSQFMAEKAGSWAFLLLLSGAILIFKEKG